MKLNLIFRTCIFLFFLGPVIGWASDSWSNLSKTRVIKGKEWTGTASVQYSTGYDDALRRCKENQVNGVGGFRVPFKDEFLDAAQEIQSGLTDDRFQHREYWTQKSLALQEGQRGYHRAEICRLDGYCYDPSGMSSPDTICVREKPVGLAPAPPPALPVPKAETTPPSRAVLPKLTLHRDAPPPETPKDDGAAKRRREEEEKQAMAAYQAKRELEALEMLQKERKRCQDPQAKSYCGCSKFLPPPPPGTSSNCLK